MQSHPGSAAATPAAHAGRLKTAWVGGADRKDTHTQNTEHQVEQATHFSRPSASMMALPCASTEMPSSSSLCRSCWMRPVVPATCGPGGAHSHGKGPHQHTRGERCQQRRPGPDVRGLGDLRAALWPASSATPQHPCSWFLGWARPGQQPLRLDRHRRSRQAHLEKQVSQQLHRRLPDAPVARDDARLHGRQQQGQGRLCVGNRGRA